jgi:hypothetical protein
MNQKQIILIIAVILSIIVISAVSMYVYSEQQPRWHFDVSTKSQLWTERGNITAMAWTFRVYRLDSVTLTNVYVTADGKLLKFVPIWEGSTTVLCQLNRYGSNDFWLTISWTGGEENFRFTGDREIG